MTNSYLDWSSEGKPALWRYAVALLLGFVSLQFGSVLGVVLLTRFLPGIDASGPALAFTFLFGMLAIFALVNFVLGRPWYSVAIASPRQVRWSDFGIGVLIGWSASIATYLVLIDADRFTYRGWQAEMAAGIPLLLLIALGYVIQTACEEVYFRGLVMQATRRLTSWIPVVIVLQAALFTSLHVGNVGKWGTGELAGLPYLLVALVLGWVAWRTGSLLMPMALHFANNSFLALVVNTSGDVLHSFAPFTVKTPTLKEAVLFEVAHSGLILLLVEGWLTWRDHYESNPLT